MAKNSNLTHRRSRFLLACFLWGSLLVLAGCSTTQVEKVPHRDPLTELSKVFSGSWLDQFFMVNRRLPITEIVLVGHYAKPWSDSPANPERKTVPFFESGLPSYWLSCLDTNSKVRLYQYSRQYGRPIINGYDPTTGRISSAYEWLSRNSQNCIAKGTNTSHSDRMSKTITEYRIQHQEILLAAERMASLLQMTGKTYVVWTSNNLQPHDLVLQVSRLSIRLLDPRTNNVLWQSSIEQKGSNSIVFSK